MQTYRTSDVFVAGGMPRLTYIPRAERNLEERLRSAEDNLCKVVTVTGATKSGKTVLVKKVFPSEGSIWVDGGTVKSEDDLWNYVLRGLAGHTETALEESKGTGSTIEGGLDGEVNLPLWLLKGKGKLGATHTSTKETTKSASLSLTPRSAAISQLRLAKRPLIIDDFHYLQRDFQGNMIRALKPLIFDGLPVILIAIPHRRYDAVKVEREMTGRLEQINIPMWEIRELVEIANEGFPLLNIEVPTTVLNQLAGEAYGSPHLMQEFCKELARHHGIDKTVTEKFHITNVESDLFKKVAEGTAKTIFDKLSKGPRQRADRVQRKLKTGQTGDIYKVTLYALSKIGPGLDTIEYEQIRMAIREVLDDKVPHAQEVTRVLEKMADIAASDEASTPVLDWEKEERKLHITDPFFAFYLKWGVKLAQ